jgi:hypothetical protein
MLGMDSREAVQLLERIKVTVIVEEDAPSKKKVPFTFSMSVYKKEGSSDICMGK